MTTPSGAISASNVNVELGRASTASCNLNEGSATVLGPRFLAGVFTGPITMNDLRSQTLFALTGLSGTVSGSGTRVGAGGVSATTAAVTGTYGGGNSPWTVAWSYVSGTTATVNSPTSLGTTFTRTATVAIGQTINLTGVYKVTITDNLGRIVTGNVTVNTSHSEVS